MLHREVIGGGGRHQNLKPFPITVAGGAPALPAFGQANFSESVFIKAFAASVCFTVSLMCSLQQPCL